MKNHLLKTISENPYIQKIGCIIAMFLRAIMADQFLIASNNLATEWENEVKAYYDRQEQHRRAHILDRRL